MNSIDRCTKTISSLTRPPITTSKSSVRMKTIFGLRYDLTNIPQLRQLHKVTHIRSKFNIVSGIETLEPISANFII